MRATLSCWFLLPRTLALLFKLSLSHTNAQSLRQFCWLYLYKVSRCQWLCTSFLSPRDLDYCILSSTSMYKSWNRSPSFSTCSYIICFQHSSKNIF
jgi:hypothetical protein